MGLSPAGEGEYSHVEETQRTLGATNGRLQQCVVSANRHARWRCCPPAICASNKRSDSNQELDCHRKMAFFAVPPAGNKVAMIASSDALEASIAT